MSSPVRVAAARALARRRPVEVLPQLLALVAAPGFHARAEDEVAALLEATAALGGDAALPTLHKLFEDRLLRPLPNQVRLAAVRTAAGIGTEAARASMQGALRMRSREVRDEAARCLQRWGAQAREPADYAAGFGG
jgi:HEAT repeat protein